MGRAREDGAERSRAAAILGFLVLGSVLGLAEEEPNNSAAEANTVRIGEEFSFQLTPRQDRDYFAVTSPGAGTLRFRVTSKVTAHPGLFPWWGETEGERPVEFRSGEWDRRVTAGERAILAVRSSRHGHNEVESDEVITAVFDYVPQVGIEPNDAPDQATPVAVGEEFTFTLTPRQDRDYFRVTAPASGTLRFRLAVELQGHRGLFPWWQVVNEAGELVDGRFGEWDRRVAEGESVVFAIRSNRHGHNEISRDEPITGIFDFVPQTGAEPNDTPEQATPVVVGEEFIFTLTPRQDHDYFRLTAPGNGTLRFRLAAELQGHRGVHPWWPIQNEAGDWVENRSGEWDRRVAEGESVVFAIRSNRHGHNEISRDDPIAGIFDFVPQVGAEPNDMPEQATPVAVGEEFIFTLTPRQDHDYFRLTSPGNGTLRFRLAAELQGHRSLHPWWPRQTEAGDWVENRSGEWDRRVAEGESVVFAIRSSLHGHNEISRDEAITGIFDFVPQVGAEPNDMPEQATPVAVGEDFTFTLTPRQDRDHFAVESPGFGTLVFRLTSELQEHQRLYPFWMSRSADGAFAEERGGQWDRRLEPGETAIFAIRSNLHGHNEISRDERITGRFEFVPQAGGGEPNDTPETATPITIGEPFEFTFLPRNDIDFFTLTAPGPGAVRLERLDTSGEHRGLFPAWHQWDRVLNGYWDTRVAESEAVVFSLRSSRHAFNETASETPVAMVARFTPEPLPSERGDTAAEAISAKIGEPFSFAILPQWDRDYVRFTAEQSGFVTVRFDPAPPRKLAFWWEKEGSEAPLHEGVVAVNVGEEVLLGLAAHGAGWSSADVFTGILEYTDGPPDPKDQARRWTFKIERGSEE